MAFITRMNTIIPICDVSMASLLYPVGVWMIYETKWNDTIMRCFSCCFTSQCVLPGWCLRNWNGWWRFSTLTAALTTYSMPGWLHIIFFVPRAWVFPSQIKCPKITYFCMWIVLFCWIEQKSTWFALQMDIFTCNILYFMWNFVKYLKITCAFEMCFMCPKVERVFLSGC